MANLVAEFVSPVITRGVAVSHPGADDPITYPTKTVAGFVYNSITENTPVEGATVLLVRQADGATVATQLSGPTGAYLFPRNTDDVRTYYVVAFSVIGTNIQIHGTSNRGIVPA